MRKNTRHLALVAALLWPLSGLGTGKETHFDLCQVLASPEKYYEKEITVRATYRSAFEASELYCSQCLDSGLVWIEFEDTDAGHKAAVQIRRQLGHMGGKVSGTFTGTLGKSGVYGHLGMYHLEIILRGATRLRTVDQLGKSPNSTDPKC